MSGGVLAYDLGAGSGRAVIGRLTDGKLTIEEIHRFPNDPVQVGSRLHWDILRLYHEIKQGLLKAKHQGIQPDSLAIDSWAVDFGLIGANGELLGNPYHYRDHHTDGVMDQVCDLLGKDYLFSRTGLQFLPFNTIYQLVALKEAGSPQLAQGQRLLMIPDLLRYFLTGEAHSEFTNATTTQLYNPLEESWDAELIGKLDLPSHLFGDVLQPGQPAGHLQPSVQEELGVGPIPVLTCAEHDTGSAVAAVPAVDSDFAYLSCGTWSLMGTELNKPLLSPEALSANFTNEGGVDGTYRFLKNIMGLWILQECRRTWEKEGQPYSFPELIALAEASEPFACLIDPDDPLFLNPVHMPRAIHEYCQRTGQEAPGTIGAVVRCVMESLALKYRYVLESVESLSGKRFAGLHMVGGGINNKLLCQFTANAIAKPVWAGPTEGSAIGNVIVQLIALGQIANLREARDIVRRSFPIETYEAQDSTAWERAYGTFVPLIGR
ncbi:rhamnulokinase [Paenibacillus sp. y28]|uniref:rhamnulokinase n=1 Tax=Paenibacillus sp. y28 TaxID=3129110 RepID=UPI00301ABBD5